MLLEILSRLQFGFTISFHILFPAFSIGLIAFIAVMEAAYLKTGHDKYLQICKFYTKILALTFGMGIVSGIVMEFQLGTNWANFTKQVGSVLGALFTYEVLTAFFIEAGFLGVMFFGWNKVKPGLHFAATLLALIGVTLSAFWIMAANSWMQTPAGAVIKDHHFVVSNWLDVIFNPSFLPRFFHMLLATYISSFLVIAAISAYYLLNRKHIHFAKVCLSFIMHALLILIPLQIVMGDRVGVVVHEYQPLKTAAIEANWQTQNGAPLVLFAWPNEKTESNDFAITIPKLASLINTHALNGKLIGLTNVAASERPPVPVVFFSFRIMVGLGFLMLFLSLAGAYLRWRKKLYDTDWFLKLCILCAPIGFISIITGWFTAEFGRQPWVVYNLIKTSAAHSPIQLYQVVISLLSIVVVYGIVFGYFYFKYFFKTIAGGPNVANAQPSDQPYFYMSPATSTKKEDKS